MLTSHLVGAVETAQFSTRVGSTILSTIFPPVRLPVFPAILLPVRTPILPAVLLTIFLPDVSRLRNNYIIAAAPATLSLLIPTTMQRSRTTIERTRAAIVHPHGHIIGHVDRLCHRRYGSTNNSGY
ncbi:MAG: hypothetical protein U0412_07015 [Nitrospira sp.]